MRTQLLAVGDLAPDCMLPDHTGTLVTFSRLWQPNGLAVHFVRHFGCPFCREQLANLNQCYHEFAALGVPVVAVAMGTVEQSAAFHRRQELLFPLLSDVDRTCYQVYGLTLGSIWQVAGVAAVSGRGLTSFLRHGFGRPVGDVRQLAGTFLINGQGVIHFVHRSRNSADNLTSRKLLELARNLPLPGPVTPHP